MSALVQFKQDLGQLIDKRELALPSNVSVEAFRNAAVVAAQDNPKVLDCDRESIFKSIRTLAAAGLVPDGREAALVPFFTKDEGRKCQAMPMVFGLIKMVRRSGEVSDIRAHIVYQKEVDQGLFEYVIGDHESLTHKPILFGDRGEPVAAYAIATLKDGNIVREFMSAEEIDKVRRSGSSQRVRKNGKSVVSDVPIGIWKDWASEMWRKSAIRRLSKRLDMSSEDMRRMMVEQDFDHMRDVTPPAPEKGGFIAKAEAARPPKEEPPAEPESPPKTDQAEPEPMVTDEDGTLVPLRGVNIEMADRKSEDFEEGKKAFAAGVNWPECPHGENIHKATDWMAGWREAKGGEE